MANDLLIAAIRESGLDLGDIAEIAEVDPRTVQRWLGGRIPHSRYRQKLATALKTDEDELWPDALTIRRRTGIAEIAGAWPRRDDPAAIDWRALFRSASQHIDLLGYSLSQILSARSINKQLKAKAGDSCRIRIAIANRNSEPVIAADLAQPPSGRLASRIAHAEDQLADLASEPGIELRQHQVATSHTILRFDDEMLLTVHLYGTPGFQAPLLHLRRERDYGLFDQLAKHLEDIWNSAKPLAGAATDEQAAAPTAPVRDTFLDDLDHVWRPGQ